MRENVVALARYQFITGTPLMYVLKNDQATEITRLVFFTFQDFLPLSFILQNFILPD